MSPPKALPRVPPVGAPTTIRTTVHTTRPRGRSVERTVEEVLQQSASDPRRVQPMLQLGPLCLSSRVVASHVGTKRELVLRLPPAHGIPFFEGLVVRVLVVDGDRSARIQSRVLATPAGDELRLGLPQSLRWDNRRSAPRTDLSAKAGVAVVTEAGERLAVVDASATGLGLLMSPALVSRYTCGGIRGVLHMGSWGSLAVRLELCHHRAALQLIPGPAHAASAPGQPSTPEAPAADAAAPSTPGVGGGPAPDEPVPGELAAHPDTAGLLRVGCRLLAISGPDRVRLLRGLREAWWVTQSPALP